jgi:hypothetical protein
LATVAGLAVSSSVLVISNHEQGSTVWFPTVAGNGLGVHVAGVPRGRQSMMSEPLMPFLEPSLVPPTPPNMWSTNR